MERDPNTTARLSAMLKRLLHLTRSGEVDWQRQMGSAHRFATWSNHLFILGPTESPEESKAPRYLFITPLDSPGHIEINSSDQQLSPALYELIRAVDDATRSSTPVDPFALTDDVLSRLSH
jgi:hypothetical protein